MNFSIFSRLPSLLARPAHTHVLPFINFQGMMKYKMISAAKFRIRWFFCNLFFKVFENLIDYLPRFTGFIDMFDTLLIIITLFLLPSLLVCLLTLRWSFNIKHLYFFLFSFVTDITDILKFRHSLPPPRLFWPPCFY